MQPGKGLSSRDSFSTCQASPDIFAHIRQPQKSLKVENSETIDTMESDEVKKELEMLKVMLDSQTNTLGSFILKGTKFFFSAALFPAHLTFFLIPKFVMRHILPKIVKVTGEAFFKCSNSFKAIAQKIALKAQVLVRLVEILKPFSSILASSFKKLAENFLSPFRKMPQVMTKIFQKIKNKVFKKLVFFGTELLAKTTKTLKKFTNYISEKSNVMLSPFKKMLHFMVKASDFTKKSEKQQPSLNLLAKTKDIYKSVSKKIESYAKSLNLKMNSQLKKVTHATNVFKKNVAKIAKPVANQLKNMQKAISSKLDKVQKKITHAILPKVKAISEAIQLHVNKALEVIKPPVILAIAFIQQINQNAINLFLNNPGIRVFKAQYASLKKMVVKVQRIQVAILKAFNRVKNEFSKMMKKLSGHAKKQGQKFKKKLLVILAIVGNSLKVFRQSVSGLFRKVIKFFVVFFRWCRIMFKFTGYLIREIFRELQTSK